MPLKTIDVTDKAATVISSDILNRIHKLTKVAKDIQLEGKVELTYSGVDMDTWDGILAVINKGKFHFQITDKLNLVLILM